MGFVEANALEMNLDSISLSLKSQKLRLFNLWRNAGVFPPTRRQYLEFCKEYELALLQSDVYVELGIANEFKIAGRTFDPPDVLPLEVLDPVLLASLGIRPWTFSLSDKRILVVHPASELIYSQISNLPLMHNFPLWLNPTIRAIAPPQTNGLQASFSLNWSENLRLFSIVLETEIREFRPDVVLVAAGSYGLPICRLVKSLGVSSVYVGGALQLVFGIWGGRWRNNTDYTRMSTRYWVENTSKSVRGSRFVENGCYW
jgi:hypothetical protein